MKALPKFVAASADEQQSFSCGYEVLNEPKNLVLKKSVLSLADACRQGPKKKYERARGQQHGFCVGLPLCMFLGGRALAGAKHEDCFADADLIAVRSHRSALRIPFTYVPPDVRRSETRKRLASTADLTMPPGDLGFRECNGGIRRPTYEKFFFVEKRSASQPVIR